MKAVKKPLLVNFIELEHEFINLAAQKKGITKTAYVRALIIKQLTKEGFDMERLK